MVATSKITSRFCKTYWNFQSSYKGQSENINTVLKILEIKKKKENTGYQGFEFFFFFSILIDNENFQIGGEQRQKSDG